MKEDHKINIEVGKATDIDPVTEQWSSYYIAEEGKKNVLEEYKYIGSDYSFISPYFQPYWEFVVTLIPKNVAPNAITFAGFLFLVAAYFITVGHCPTLEGEAPFWVFLMNGLFIFVYQTLDAVDGKQARRTSSSSPLGELFDHGCDSVSAMMITIVSCSVCQYGPTWFSYISMMMITGLFFSLIWEQYYSEVLSLQPIAGPTEGQLLAIGANILSIVGGPGLWKYTLFTLPYSLIEINFRVVSAAGILFVCISGICVYIRTLYKIDLNAEDFNKKGRPIEVAFPYLFLVTLFTVWMAISPQDILHQHTFLCCSCFGLCVSYLITRIVICRVCHQKAPQFYYVLLPLPLIVFNAISGINFQKSGINLISQCYIPEFYLLIAYFFYVLAFHGHMTYDVISTLCYHLNIYLFSLKNVHK